ncbi:MAG: hypothetical protein IJX90_00415 [Blautia sp.]|nr:hypothetical protein [Blautia sp.]
MAKYNNQKAKILFLQQMLYETGENHTISMQEILDELSRHDIRAERKSIYDDMEVLRYFGMDIRYRRERPSGYYLAGITKEIHVEKIPLPEKVEEVPAEPVPAAVEDVMEEPAREPDHKSWMKMNKAVDKKKQMKLVCTESVKKDVKRFFGGTEDFKEREYGDYVVTAPLLEDQKFFGWLTAMGTDVHLQKPKRTVQLYRDYLKTLAKDYKVEK